MTRVLDNLFQNILRHAAEGKYTNIVVDVEKELIIVADRGPGMDNSSYEGGAGIGLSASNYILNATSNRSNSFSRSSCSSRDIVFSWFFAGDFCFLDIDGWRKDTQLIIKKFNEL